MPRRRDAPVRRATQRVQVTVLDDGAPRHRPDQLATEEPMEIRLHGPGEEPTPVAVTLRTPGNDFELAVGFLHAEGLVDSADDVASVAYCLGPDGEQEYNVVTVRHRTRVAARVAPRTFVANSSCGLCGKTKLDEIEQHCPSLAGVGPRVARSVLHSLPHQLEPAQAVFASTGGLHAAARFTADGTLFALREDVGRHNALDKLVGEALLARALPLHDDVLLVSGRLGFELVQKAALAGITVIAAIGAPSSLAVDAARRFGITTIAFLKADRANVYSVPERIDQGS
jgi:FdhD protein